jgi:hypothetical protein
VCGAIRGSDFAILSLVMALGSLVASSVGCSSNASRTGSESQQDWGFAIKISSKDTPWGRDMDRLFLALAVVDNNTATSVGGGGTPRQPLAPPFASQ